MTLQLFSFPFYNSNPMLEWKSFAVGVHAQFKPLKPELFAAQSGKQCFPKGYLVFAFLGALLQGSNSAVRVYNDDGMHNARYPEQEGQQLGSRGEGLYPNLSPHSPTNEWHDPSTSRCTSGCPSCSMGLLSSNRW